MEIILKQGIDKIKFGMLESDIIQLLGRPDKTFVDQDSADELIYQYNSLKLRLSFYLSEGKRLGYIRCANPDLIFAGKLLLFKNIDYVIKKVFPFSEDEWDLEEEQFFNTLTNEKYWLVLNCEYDEVTDIELGVPFTCNDEYDWPES